MSDEQTTGSYEMQNQGVQACHLFIPLPRVSAHKSRAFSMALPQNHSLDAELTKAPI